MSRRFPAVLRLALSPARGWAATVAAVHALAAGVAVVWMPLPAALLVCAGLAASGWTGVRTALLRGADAVREVELRADGSAAYVDRHGEWKAAEVEGTASLGHWLAALRLRAGGERRDVLLLRGALDPADFRRARVWARWRRLPAA